MAFVRVRDLNVYYEIHGSGPRLLFIGGTGGDLRQNPNVFGGSLAKAFTLLAYDQRGLGRTDVPEAPYTMADYAEDADALLDAVGWETCQVMGVSFGGMVAQELAVRHPQRVSRMVLACTSSGGAGGASYPLHELASLDIGERVTRVILLSDTRRDAEWQASHATELEAIQAQRLEVAQVGAGEEGRDTGRNRQLEARRHHDTFDRLPALTMPVFLCGGKYDGIAPVDNQEALERQIPNAHLEFFEGGHLFLLEDRRAFQRVIAFLLGEQDNENGQGDV